VLKFRFIFSLTVTLQLLISSCSDNKENSLYTITSKDFEDVLVIEGIVEPVQSVNIPCPRGINGGTITFIAEDGAFVNKGDTICIIEDVSRENRYDKLLNDMEAEEARLAKARVDAEMEHALLDAQVKSNEVNANIAQLDSLQILYASPTERRIKELELQQVIIERNKYKKKLETLEVIQKSDIRKIELRIARLQNNIDNMKRRLDEQIITAPQSGILVRAIHYDTEKKIEVGDLAWGNMPMLSIPGMQDMKVKIEAPERDYKYINIGNETRYTFDAIPGNTAYGKITKKAPMGRPVKRNSKVKIFDIEASIDSVQKMPEPGFTTVCQILLKQVKDTIVIPQIAIFEDDSIKVSYVKLKNGFEKRQILTGLTSAKEAIITAGLSRNEVVSLSKPQASDVKNIKLLPDSIAKPQTSTP